MFKKFILNHYSVTEKHVNLLVKWFKNNSRSLPWRTNFPRSAYAVWISEIMLQQTQVFAVVNYFNRWMEKFPTIQKLAEATEEDVLQSWAGLGYYSRARNILKTAKKIMYEYEGIFPSSRQDILKLNGIGEYTVGAILSFSYLQKEPILDGNLKRLFSRLFGIEFLPISKEEQIIYWNYSRNWISYGSSEWVNEALMELGAIICVPKQPKCLECPLKGNCYANTNQKQNIFPPAKKKQKMECVFLSTLVIKKSKQYLVTKKGRFLNGQLQFPMVEELLEVGDNVSFKESLFKIEKLLGQFKHFITNHKIQVKVFEIQNVEKKRIFVEKKEMEWIQEEDLQRKMTHSLGQKIVKIISG